jgi:DNA replication and repair protein RecF
VYRIHWKLSGEKEELLLTYEPNCSCEELKNTLFRSREKDLLYKNTSVGPHRDDIRFTISTVDIRKYGSQGQQRTAALSLKLAEIEVVENRTKDKPVLLLDDVLSELDNNRQNELLNNIGHIQTIMTCAGLDSFVKNRFEVNKIYRVVNGKLMN